MSENPEVAELRRRLAEAERELTARSAEANAAIAAAQDRSYWLDRWHLDLNALMAKPGAAEFRALLRLARGALRTVRLAKRHLLG